MRSRFEMGNKSRKWIFAKTGNRGKWQENGKMVRIPLFLKRFSAIFFSLRFGERPFFGHSFPDMCLYKVIWITRRKGLSTNNLSSMLKLTALLSSRQMYLRRSWYSISGVSLNTISSHFVPHMRHLNRNIAPKLCFRTCHSKQH